MRGEGLLQGQLSNYGRTQKGPVSCIRHLFGRAGQLLRVISSLEHLHSNSPCKTEGTIINLSREGKEMRCWNI